METRREAVTTFVYQNNIAWYATMPEVDFLKLDWHFRFTGNPWE